MHPFAHRIAILGNPVTPDTRFDDSQLSRLRALGFNTVQLNIAWGSRPPLEPLNLEDVLPLPGVAETAAVAACREELRRRARQCRQHGLRTLFHFGAPHVGGLYRQFREQGLEASQRVEACLLLPQTTRLYQALVRQLAQACPEIDDLLLYTYDQEAWLCSEFGACPRCHGVPLHERLPPFLRALRDAWAEARPDSMLWWEPWELSAGETLIMARHVPKKNFGLMLHGNIAEVQITHRADTWFRNMTALCAARGLPVVAETFLASATEEVQPLSIPCPRLVHETLTAFQAVPGVCGIKEYFGLLPDQPDPNLAMAGLFFNDPSITIDDALERLAADYGEARVDILATWHHAAAAMEMFPWDVCWKWRRLGGHSVWHGWQAYRLPGHLVDSPSWCSTRRTVFMTTENEQLHPWFYEDVGLRCQLSAEQFDAACLACQHAAERTPAAQRVQIEAWYGNLAALRRVVRAYQCHIQESLLADHLRSAVSSSKAQEDWIRRLRAVLVLDADNQAGAGPAPQKAITAAAMLAAFDGDPLGWVQQQLRQA